MDTNGANVRWGAKLTYACFLPPGIRSEGKQLSSSPTISHTFSLSLSLSQARLAKPTPNPTGLRFSMAAPAWQLEPSLGSDRLSHEIFSILESNFLFGSGPTSPLSVFGDCAAGRVRVLSIDGGCADGGLLAGTALVRLERRLRDISGDPTAHVADFFDLAAGSGAGAFLAAALFARRLPADETLAVLSKNHKLFSGRSRKSIFRRPEGIFRQVFGDMTVRDAAKPLLVPCYDLETAAPFVFSRADAVEAEAFDFPLWQVCAASCGVGPKEVASVDGLRRLRAAKGGETASAAVANPTAVAVTHVLHNKREFPFASGFGDILVLSLGGGGGGASSSYSGRRLSASGLLRIAGACQADMVDQAVAMAFGESRASDYIRIQGNGISPERAAEAALTERSVESVLFRGKRVMEETNGERLDSVAGQLVKEHDRRRRRQCKIPTVMIKPSVTPRTSSSSASTLITVSTAESSESP